MNNGKGVSLVALCCCGFSVSAAAQSIDIGYLKQQNPKLYQQLMQIERCRTQAKLPECQAASATSHSTVAAPVAETAAAAETAPPPGKWWFASSYYGGQPKQQWWHVAQLSADLELMDGNVEGEQYDLSANYFSRYAAWTNLLSLIYQKDDVKQSGIVALDTKKSAFNYGGRYDFNQTWYGQLGYIAQQDTSQLLDLQQVLYAGAGAHVVNNQHVTLSTMLAGGYQDDKFVRSQTALTGVSSLDYAVTYAVQELTWKLSDRINLNQSLSWVYSLDDMPEFAPSLAGDAVNPACLYSFSATASYCVVNEENKSTLQLMLGLEYQISAAISLLYNYSYEKDSLPWLNVKDSDTSNSLSIRATFQ
ncbi:DUF481 domain-containing protein [Rheinheimera sp.]|uniref:DUF481 domain-containing protein n=1 Tax=Rheinheimera sp. TaxID=1869214 RepID=UPI00307DC4E8